jgi:DNA topoisomerase 2-associated protein PAT1
LMNMEDHERRMPPPPNQESSPEDINAHNEWEKQLKGYNERLWKALKVHEQIVPK